MFKNNEDTEKASCPFNKNHVFAREKLIFHINRCKDRDKVAHLFSTCQYNGLHFVKKEELEMHELTCSDRMEVKRMIELMKRNFANMRERSRSRERREKAEEEDEDHDRIHKKEENEEEEEEEITLSDCEDCQNLLRDLVIDDHPKLKKYLIKYEELSKVKFES
jgi:hypothetical protein